MGNKFKLLIILFCFIFIPIKASAKDINEVELGSYINYYPSETSYTTSNTGAASRTINPSELTSWRVLKINDDNTIEIISTNVSTNTIIFSGTTGYRYYVDVLEKVAQSYINSLFASSARSFGYNGQTLILPNSGIYNATYSFERPWSSTTSNNNNESSGGGDILYQKDINLMNAASIPLNATKINETTDSKYYVASRQYASNDTWSWYFDARFVSGSLLSANGLRNCISYNLNSPSTDFSVRPIVTLKNDLKVTGTGTEEDPYKIILYTIEFDSDEGSSVDDQYVYNVDSKITKPEDPTKVGHIFKGWFKDEDLTEEWNFETTTVTANTTLYAKWQKEEYTISFNTNDISDQKVLYGNKITKPEDPTKDGYKFVGWYIDEELTNKYDFDESVSSSITLYAKWMKIENNPKTGVTTSNWLLIIALYIIGLFIAIIAHKRIKKLKGYI